MRHDEPRDGASRRTFLKRLALAGGALLIAGERPAPAHAAPPARRLGVQLYTLRDRMQEDFEGTVEQVAAVGYHEVEFAGYYDRTPEQVRALLDRLDLTSPSVHVGLDQLRDDLDGRIAAARTIGHRYLTVPALMEAFQGKMTPASWKEYAAEFNRIGEALRKADLRFAYHNHHFEFVPAGDDRTGFDVLLQETDPALVSFELDLMWATVAGHDPVALFERYPGRFVMWHVKDVAGIADVQAAAKKPGMEGFPVIMQGIRAVGEGDIDFARLFARAETSGLQHFFVENDAPKDALADVRTSYANLAKLLGGE